ncbi:MAG: TetR/AcrR family transcriptional regulator [Gammaproteobacteria bacterium]|nr:TetR/AcrR family transcriptional regulator [Gammaproteobacteria bacterium]
MSGQRGRPRKYDAQTALRAAGEVFWSQGFSGTSLDDLSAAMGMNRPSIYRAFGDKEAVYRLALAQFTRQMEEGFSRTILHEADLRRGLRKFYRAALEVYSAGDTTLGCMVMCTAPAAAVVKPNVQSDLLEVIEQLDARILGRVELAVEQGEISEVADTRSLSKLIQAVLHSLAIRVRAGESKASLRRFADAATATLLGET